MAWGACHSEEDTHINQIIRSLKNGLWIIVWGFFGVCFTPSMVVAVSPTPSISIVSPLANSDQESGARFVTLNATVTAPDSFRGYLAYTINSDFMTGSRVTRNIGSLVQIPVTENAGYTLRVGLVNLNNAVITPNIVKSVVFGVKSAEISGPEFVLTSGSSPYTSQINDLTKTLKIGKFTDASVVFTGSSVTVGNVSLGDRKYISSTMTVQNTVSVNGLVVIGKSKLSSGSLIVSAGTLKVPKIVKGEGSATLSLTGGLVQVKEFGLGLTNSGGTIQSISKITTVNGNLVQTGGRIKLRMRSVSDTDKLVVTGVFTGGGILEVVTSNPVVFNLGDKIDFFDAGTKVGTFNTVTLPRLPASLKWITTSLNTHGIVSIGRSDRDNDGIADVEDAFPDDSIKYLPSFDLISPVNFELVSNGKPIGLTLNAQLSSSLMGTSYIAYTINAPFTKENIQSRRSTVNSTLRTFSIITSPNTTYVVRVGMVDRNYNINEQIPVITRRVAVVDPASFAPTDFSDLYAWFDSKDVSSLVLDGANRVSKWSDKSGTNHHATLNVLSLSYRPLYKPSEGTLQFSSSALAVDLSGLAQSDYTIFSVDRRKSSNANHVIGTQVNVENKGLAFPYKNGNQAVLSQYENNLEGSIPEYSIPTWNIAVGKFDSAVGHSLYFNGANIAENENKTGLLESKKGFIGRGNLGQSYLGDLGEIIIFKRALSEKERITVENYLADKWAINNESLEPDLAPRILGVGYNVDNMQSRSLTTLDIPLKNLKIGRGFSGSVTVGTGASISVANTSLAENKFTTASMTINGNSATFLSDGNLTIGKYGAAQFSLTKGSVEVTDTLTLGQYEGSSGVLNFNGGSLTVKHFVKGSGSTEFNWTAGVLSARLIDFSLLNTQATLNLDMQPTQIHGDYAQGASGVMSVKIGNLSSGNLRVSGNVTLAGTLSLTHEPGFIPKSGTKIKLLTISGSLSGSFTKFKLPIISQFAVWSTQNLYTTGELEVVDTDKDRDGIIDFQDTYILDPKRSTPNIVLMSPNNGTEYAASDTLVPLTVSADVAASFRGLYAYTVNEPFETGTRISAPYQDNTSWNVMVSGNNVYRIQIGLISTANEVIPSVSIRSVRIAVKDPSDRLADNELISLGTDDKIITQIIGINQPSKTVRVGESASPLIYLNGHVTANYVEVAGKRGTNVDARFSVGVTKNMRVLNDLTIGRDGIGKLSINAGTVTINRKIVLGKNDTANGEFIINKGSVYAPEISKGSGNGKVYLSGGTLSVSKITVPLVQTSGVLNPARRIGRLKLTQGYKASADAVLCLELAGQTPSTNYDVVEIDGDTELYGGRLRVVFAQNFSISEPATFNIFTFRGRVLGQFSEIQLPTIANFLDWDTDRLYSDGIIRTIIADKDRDGISDSKDPFPNHITGNITVIKPLVNQIFPLNTSTVAVKLKTNIGEAFRGSVLYSINKPLTMENGITINAVVTVNISLAVQNGQAYTIRATLIATDNSFIDAVLPAQSTFTVDSDSDEDGFGNSVDAFPYDASEWLDSDSDGVGNRHDAYPNDVMRSTSNIQIVSPTPNAEFSDIVTTVQLRTQKTVSEAFDGHWRFRINSTFPDSGLAGGTVVTRDRVSFPVSPNHTYRVSVALVQADGYIVTQSVVRQVLIRTVYDYNRDTDRDSVPDLLDIEPLNPARSSANLILVSPLNNASFSGNTTTVSLTVRPELAAQAKVYWGFALNQELQVQVATQNLFQITLTGVELRVSKNRLYEVKIGLYSPEGRLIQGSSLKQAKFSVRSTEGAATSIPDGTTVSINSSVSKPEEQLDIDGKIVIKAGAKTEFKQSAIGIKENGKAEVNLQDAGTKLQINNELILGKSSTLNIQSGAYLGVSSQLRVSGNMQVKDAQTRVSVSDNVVLDVKATLSLDGGAKVSAKGLVAASGNVALKNNSELYLTDTATINERTYVQVSNGSQLRTAQSLHLTSGSLKVSSRNTSLSIQENFKVGGSSTVTLNQGASLLVSGKLVSSGNIDITGTGSQMEISGEGVIQNNEFRVDQGAKLRAVSLNVQAGKLIIKNDDSEVVVTQGVTIHEGASLAVEKGASMIIKNGVNANGTLTISSQNSELNIAKNLIADRATEIQLSDKSRLKINGDFDLAGRLQLGETTTLNVGGTLILKNEMQLQGHVRTSVLAIEEGTITGNGTLSADLIKGNASETFSLSVSGWTIAPGQSPGSTTVSGNLMLDDASGFRMEIAGTKTTSMDRVIVTDTFSPNGELEVVLISEFIPTMNETFNLFTWGELADGSKFDVISLPILPEDIAWDLSTFYSDGTLRIKRVYFDPDRDGVSSDVDVFPYDPLLIYEPVSVGGLSVTNGLSLWLSAKTPHSVHTVTASVLQTWVDMSGKGNHFKENDESSKRPTYVSGGFSSRNIIANGTTSLKATGNAVITSQNHVEVFAVISPGTIATDQTLLSFGDREFEIGIFGGQLSLKQSGYMPSVIAATGLLPNRTQIVNIRTWVESTQGYSEIMVDGQYGKQKSVYSVASPEFASKVRYVLGRPSGEGFIGKCGEMIIFNRILSAEERQKIEKYLQSKWQLSSKKPEVLFQGQD